MNSDVDNIILIKDQLREKLKWNEWYRAIRITAADNGKFLIKVIVSEVNNEILKIVPTNFEGITVILAELAKEEFQGE